MRVNKPIAVIAAVWAAICLQGCNKEPAAEVHNRSENSRQVEVSGEGSETTSEASEQQSVELDSEQYLALSERGKKIAEYFASFPKSHQSMLEIDMDGIYMQTNGGTYGQENMDAFLADIQNGKAAELTKISYTVEGDPIFYYLCYDGTNYYYLSDTSRDHFGGKDWYFEGNYTYLRTFERESPEYWIEEYVLTNDPDGDYENLSDGIHFYHIGTEKAPEDVIPIYSADYEAVSKGLREDGFFYEEDSEKGGILQITDGKAENPEVWDAFYEQVQNNKTCQLNIQETFSDGRSLARWLHYAGDIYWQDEYLVDYVIYFGNDPEYEPRTWYIEPGEWDLEEFIALTGYDYELWNMEMFYVYETDGHMKVGLGSDRSDMDEEYWLTEEDYGTNMMEPVIEFDR